MWIDEPSWSLDGRRVAFHAERYDALGIQIDHGVFVGDLDGSCGPRLCHVHPAASLPRIETYRDDASGLVEYRSASMGISWSADGRSVVYERLDATGTTVGIYIADMGAFGDAAMLSTDSRVPVDLASRPRFSPTDPNVIAFVLLARRNASRVNDLATTTRAGGSYRLVTTATNFTGGSIGQYAWSPDGVWFAFNAPNKALTRDEVWKIRPAASKATLVLSTAGRMYSVTDWE